MWQLGPQTVRIADIRPNPVALRTVDKESEGFLGLVDSIKLEGITNAISVRNAVAKDDKGAPTGEEYLELIDGLHRYTAALQAGLTEIPAIVMDKDDKSVLIVQMMANFHRIVTRPAEYAQQLRRLMDMDRTLTSASLADSLGVSTKYIDDRLALNKIENKKIKELIDNGDIKLGNAYALSKLPVDEQDAWVERAISQTPEEFVPAVTARRKEISELRRSGKDATVAVWAPIAIQRKIAVVKDELGLGETRGAAHRAQQTLLTPGMTAEEAFQLGIKWTLRLDPISVKEQEDKEAKRAAEREETKKAAALAKAEKKQKSAKHNQEIADLESTIAKGFMDGSITDADAANMRSELKKKWDAITAAEEKAASE